MIKATGTLLDELTLTPSVLCESLSVSDVVEKGFVPGDLVIDAIGSTFFVHVVISTGKCQLANEEPAYLIFEGLALSVEFAPDEKVVCELQSTGFDPLLTSPLFRLK